MTAQKIDLNADMGESFGAYSMGNDAAMLGIVSSANIACGFHGGDPVVLTKTVALAGDNGVALGAHPSFPDLQGFGRRKMHLSASELAACLTYQIGALQGIAAAQGQRVVHVKPHGALNNMASVDLEMALTIARAIKALDPTLILMATAGSCLFQAGEQVGLPTAGEIFSDRTYQEDGTLTPRSQPDAMIHEPSQSVAQILRFLEAGGIVTPSGAVIKTPIHSVCVHGDSQGALAIAQSLRQELGAAGVTLCALQDALG